jgi:hypothetical protein
MLQPVRRTPSLARRDVVVIPRKKAAHVALRGVSGALAALTRRVTGSL